MITTGKQQGIVWMLAGSFTRLIKQRKSIPNIHSLGAMETRVQVNHQRPFTRVCQRVEAAGKHYCTTEHL